MATATGMPPAMKSRKKTFNMWGTRSVVAQGGFGTLEHAVAAAPVDACDLRGTKSHGGEAEQAHAVDDVHRRVDDGHARLVADLLHHLPGHEHGGGEEGGAQHVHG